MNKLNESKETRSLKEIWKGNRSNIEKREQQRKRICESLVTGVITFIFLSVVLKLFFKCDAWKSYAIVDSIATVITSCYVSFTCWKDNGCDEGDNLIRGIVIFFIVAFILGVIMSSEKWLSYSFHIGITTMVIGFWEDVCYNEEQRIKGLY